MVSTLVKYLIVEETLDEENKKITKFSVTNGTVVQEVTKIWGWFKADADKKEIVSCTRQYEMVIE